MSYTTDDDLATILSERTLIQLSADDPLAGVPNWDIVAESRAYADAQVDARIRQRYSLPLAETPRELRDWALALARRWLYERRPDQDVPPAVIDAAKEALASLDAVRDGKMSLAIASAPEGETLAPESGRVRVVAPERVFTAEVLGRY